MIILLHTSKTMRHEASGKNATKPLFSSQATELSNYLKSLSVEAIQKTMALSAKKALETHTLVQGYSENNPTYPAIDMFLGDIYSGFQTQSLSEEDRTYAQNHLLILSGLYGMLRPLDGVQPYRLEMGYKLPGNQHDSTELDVTSMYLYWGDQLAKALPKNETIINLSAVEYTKALFPHFKTIEGLKDVEVITPKFLTISPKTGQPIFVTVHAKIARGAFARWIIEHKIEDPLRLKKFHELGYKYDPSLSTAEQPVFVAKEFKGLGLSVRLIDKKA